MEAFLAFRKEGKKKKSSQKQWLILIDTVGPTFMFDQEGRRTDTHEKYASGIFHICSSFAFSILLSFFFKKSNLSLQGAKIILHRPSCFSATPKRKKTFKRRWEQIILCYWQEQRRRNNDIREDKERFWGALCLPSGRHSKPRQSTLSWADGCSAASPPLLLLFPPSYVRFPVAPGWGIQECEKRI